MIFNKYEFESEAKWLEVKKTLYITEILDGEEVIYLRPEVNSIVEIGFICFAYEQDEDDNVTCTDLSTRFAVDMLLNEPLDTLNGYLVYPNPVGVHTFSGDNGLYLENFCKVYPDSPYCKIDENEDILE